MSEKDKKIYNLSIDHDTHRAIRFLAIELEMSMSELIQKIIDRYLEKRKNKKDNL